MEEIMPGFCRSYIGEISLDFEKKCSYFDSPFIDISSDYDMSPRDEHLSYPFTQSEVNADTSHHLSQTSSKHSLIKRSNHNILSDNVDDPRTDRISIGGNDLPSESTATVSIPSDLDSETTHCRVPENVLSTVKPQEKTIPRQIDIKTKSTSEVKLNVAHSLRSIQSRKDLFSKVEDVRNANRGIEIIPIKSHPIEVDQKASSRVQDSCVAIIRKVSRPASSLTLNNVDVKGRSELFSCFNDLSKTDSLRFKKTSKNEADSQRVLHKAVYPTKGNTIVNSVNVEQHISLRAALEKKYTTNGKLSIAGNEIVKKLTRIKANNQISISLKSYAGANLGNETGLVKLKAESSSLYDVKRKRGRPKGSGKIKENVQNVSAKRKVGRPKGSTKIKLNFENLSAEKCKVGRPKSCGLTYEQSKLCETQPESQSLPKAYTGMEIDPIMNTDSESESDVRITRSKQCNNDKECEIRKELFLNKVEEHSLYTKHCMKSNEGINSDLVENCDSFRGPIHILKFEKSDVDVYLVPADPKDKVEHSVENDSDLRNRHKSKIGLNDLGDEEKRLFLSNKSSFPSENNDRKSVKQLNSDLSKEQEVKRKRGRPKKTKPGRQKGTKVDKQKRVMALREKVSAILNEVKKQAEVIS